MERRGDFHDLQAWQEQLGGHAQWAITQHRLNEKHVFHLHQCSHEGSNWKCSWKEITLCVWVGSLWKTEMTPANFYFARHRQAFLILTSSGHLLCYPCMLKTLTGYSLLLQMSGGANKSCYILSVAHYPNVCNVHYDWWNEAWHDAVEDCHFLLFAESVIEGWLRLFLRV